MKKIIIQFNEGNFDLIEKYAKKYNLEGFKNIINFKTKIKTTSEEKYEHLEPWIQWFSFYTGKSFKEHNIFHLGDSKSYKLGTFLDEISLNNRIGCFCCMNLPFSDKFSVYISDPWSRYGSDKSFSSKFVYSAVEQVVNSNNKFKISIKSILGLLYLIGIPKGYEDIKILYLTLLSYIKKNRPKLVGYFDYYFTKYSFERSIKKKIDYMFIFLNGIAHIQHRFLSTSEFVETEFLKNKIKNKEDSILEILRIYDFIFKKFLSNFSKNCEIWIITGLSQKIYEKSKLYWRISNHKNFFKEFFNFDFETEALMTRDFKISCQNSSNFKLILDFLKESVIINENDIQISKAFGFIDLVDEKKVFASFLLEIDKKNKFIKWKNIKVNLENYLEFVAFKNGEHNQIGWAFYNKSLNIKMLPIWKLGHLVK
jgi:hypothetical protein